MRTPLDHAAFLTWDTGKTHHFYVHVMGWPLVKAWGNENGDPPFFITGYDAGGWLIEFEEQLRLPRAAPAPAPAFPHFGLVAADDDEITAWRERLVAEGVPYEDLGKELFFADPNSVTFQVFQKSWHGTPEEVLKRSVDNLAAWLART